MGARWICLADQQSWWPLKTRVTVMSKRLANRGKHFFTAYSRAHNKRDDLVGFALESKCETPAR